MSWPLGAEAFFWGIASAVSLPLGALFGLWAQPGKKITSALMAFGAGALLFALTIELFGVALRHTEEHGYGVLLATILGALCGGVLFDVLNQTLNNRGAFSRSLSNAKKYVIRLKWRAATKATEALSHVEILNALPAEDIAKLIPHLKRETFSKDQVIFREGDVGTTLYFIISGDVEVSCMKEGGGTTEIARLTENDTFGEMAILTHHARAATVIAREETHVFKILKSDFDAVLASSPRLQQGVKKLLDERVEDLMAKVPGKYPREAWKTEALDHLGKLSMPVTDHEIDEECRTATQKGGAALAIWLGILIDGIPESLVIGMLVASAAGVSVAFIAGVFMANLPEATSSAVGMQRNGMGLGKIFWMWTSLCAITGVGAFIGTILFPAHPAENLLYVVSAVEGLAGGAMLTMIAETMLPEAFEQGGAIVGITTLCGFLAALALKIV
ncbi:MAG: cyclic nucleotide-binding domain-containing protein [Acidobacteriota bacterium]